MEEVMNNNDLRGEIFSFFRSRKLKTCQNCKKYIMYWQNNNVNISPTIEWNNFISCHNCFRKNYGIFHYTLT